MLLPLAFAVVAFVVGFGWAWLARDRPVAPSADPAVPEGLGPVQLVYAAGYVVGPEALAATLMHQAAQRLTGLEDGGGTRWTVRGRAPTRAWRGADPVAKAVGASLDVEFAGATFTVGGPGSAETLEEARAYAEATAARWHAGLLAPSAVGVVGNAAAWAAPVLAGLLVVFGEALWALPFAVFTLGGLALLGERRRQRLTPGGRAVAAAGLGLRARFADGPAAADAAEHLALLPHAWAFGFGPRWAELWRDAHGGDPPAAPWCSYEGWGPGSADVADFAAVVLHAFEPPEPEPRERPARGDGMYAGWQ